MQRTGLKWLRYAGLFFVLALCRSGFSQNTGASLVGVVRDSGGAAVANATVTATNKETNAHKEQQSNEQGEYTLLDLDPGTYSLHVEASGFRSYDQVGIRLDLNQAATQNIALTVGQVRQTVTVNADVSDLDTVTSQLSDEVTGNQLRDLPLNSRNPYSLLELVPGFSGSIGDDYNSVSISVDGGLNGYSDVLVDGTPAGFPTVNGNSGIGIFPSIDAIGEFRLLAQNYPAEFGRSLDGIINVVYKSGTNQFHGTAFEFLRNNALDANDYFSNQHGAPLPAFHRSQFGGTLDGPIYKNKTFFLVSTELLRQNSFASVTTTVPTLAQRNGDFSQTFGANGNLISIYNPFTTRANPSPGPNQPAFIRDLFPNNIIPASVMSQVALKTLQYFPLPNTTGAALTNANNYFANGSSIDDITSWDVRVDHTISDRQKVFARYSNRVVQNNPNPLFPAAQAIAEGLINQDDYNRGLTVAYTATPNPNMIFDARLGFSRTLFLFLNQSLGFQASQLGLPATLDAAGGTALFPTFSPTGYTTLGNEGNRHNAFMTYSLLSSLTVVRGHHTFKVGFDGRMIRVNDHESNDSSGNFDFGTNFTSGPDPNTATANTGNGLASFLVGTGTGDLIQNFKDDASQSFYLAEYLQDDWRVNPKLTLNLGVRYDLDTPRTERFNRTNWFDPTIASPLASAVPGLEGGLVFVGINGQSRHQYNIDTNNVAPRVGFAYAALPTTVVHGGGAIVYGPSAQAAAGTVGPYGFRVQNTWVSSLDGITPHDTLDNPFPQGFQPPPGAADGLLTGVGSQIEGAIRNTPTPYVVQWHLDVQQTLPQQMVFDIAYVGNRGRKQQQSREGGIDFNQLPVADLALGDQLTQSVANPYFGSITTGALADSTTSTAQLLKHFSQFTSVLPLFLSGGNSQYDGLQLRIDKRFNSGLQLQGSYVWSKNLANGTNHQNSFDPLADYAVSSQDIRQRFIINYIYQLPFGRGRMFGGNISRLEDLALGGWQINGITTLETGTPLQISASNNLAAFNFQTLYADTNFQNATLHGAVKKRLGHYFNTTDFSQPGTPNNPFALGDGPAYYDNLRAPGLDSTDLSIFKEFSAVESLKVQFRAEAFNAFNHPQFGSPNTTVTSTSFGQITSQNNLPRQLQFGLKLLF